MSRCIAIAAHGRRCQQTAQAGDDYCWHHGELRRQKRGVEDDVDEAAQERLVDLLGTGGAARLIAFLESGKPGRVRLIAGPEGTGLEVSRDPRDELGPAREGSTAA